MKPITVGTGGRTSILAAAVVSISLIELLGLFSSSVWARVASISLKELVNSSDLIVVATVTKVEKDLTAPTPQEGYLPAPEVATATVQETWKGTPGPEVRFEASPTWMCDVSGANVGERVVLFLTKGSRAPLYSIAHSGRGRMPLREADGRLYATIRVNDMQLPNGTKTIPDPANEQSERFSRKLRKELGLSDVDNDQDPKFWIYRSVPFGTLKELVTHGETKESRQRRNSVLGLSIISVVLAGVAFAGVRARKRVRGGRGLPTRETVRPRTL